MLSVTNLWQPAQVADQNPPSERIISASLVIAIIINVLLVVLTGFSGILFLPSIIHHYKPNTLKQVPFFIIRCLLQILPVIGLLVVISYIARPSPRIETEKGVEPSQDPEPTPLVPSPASEKSPISVLPHPALSAIDLENALGTWRAEEENTTHAHNELEEQLKTIRQFPNQVAEPLILKLDCYHKFPPWNWTALHDLSIVELSTNQQNQHMTALSRCPQKSKENIPQLLQELPNLETVRFRGMDLLCNLEKCATVKTVEIFEDNYVGWKKSKAETNALGQILSMKNLVQVSLHGSIEFFQSIPPLSTQIKQLEVELTDRSFQSITSQLKRIINPLLFLEKLKTNFPVSVDMADFMPTLNTFIIAPKILSSYSYYSNLEDGIVPFLQNLDALQCIDIDLGGERRLEVEKLVPLVGASQIHSLRLHDTGITQIPKTLLRMKTLISIDLSKNRIQGTYDFSKLFSLKTLMLNENPRLEISRLPSQLEEVNLDSCIMNENMVNDFLSTAHCLQKIGLCSAKALPTLPEKVWELNPCVEVLFDPSESEIKSIQHKLFEKKHSDGPYIYLSNPQHIKNILSKLHHLIQPEVYSQWMTRASFQTTKRYLAACNPQDLKTLEGWISKASTTEDVLNGSTGKGFSNWIITLFEALAVDQETHYLVLNHMEAGLENCSDRGVLSILDLSIYLRAVIASKNSSLKELATICLKSIIPYRIINDRAQEVAQTLFLADESIDMIAVCVQIMLSANKQFDFELPLESCRYQIDIEPHEIDSILQGCRHILKRAKPEELLIDNGFWLEALEKRHNKEFRAIHETKMAALALLPDEDQTNTVLLKQITTEANLALLNLTTRAMEDDCPASSP